MVDKTDPTVICEHFLDALFNFIVVWTTTYDTDTASVVADLCKIETAVTCDW